MEDLLKVENVTKKYSSTIALDNINLNIGKGKIIGYWEAMVVEKKQLY